MNVSLEETGKVIASIKIGKKKITLKLDNGEEFSLSQSAYTEHPFYEGKVLDDETYRLLVTLTSEDHYKNAVTRYVLKDSHTVYEARQYLLKKGADPAMTDRLVKHLETLGYLDDQLFAEAYARDTAGVRLYGRTRILAELRAKGISDEILSSLEFNESRELSKARRYASLANKKYAKNTNIKKMYKVTSALLRRGFDEHIAEEAARLEFVTGDPELERERLRKEAQRAKARYSRKYHGYDLSRKIFANLARKGYPYEMIQEVLKEMNDEDFGNE